MNKRLSTDMTYPLYSFGPFNTDGRWNFRGPENSVWYITDVTDLPHSTREEFVSTATSAMEQEAANLVKDREFLLDAIGRGHLAVPYNHWRNVINRNRQFNNAEEHHSEFQEFCRSSVQPIAMLWSTVEGRFYYAFTFNLSENTNYKIMDLGSNEVPFDYNAPKDIHGTLMKSMTI